MTQVKLSTEEQNIKIAVDAAIFTVQHDELMVLLIQMKKKPFANVWALPGGLMEQEETTENAARRILKIQTGVSDVYLEQLGTFDDPKRDPFGRVISVAYFALVPSEGVKLETTDKYADVQWWSVQKLPSLAYDHSYMVQVTLERVRAKLGYTNVIWSLLPSEFTLSQLHRMYEVVLGHSLDKRNFLRKVLHLDFVVPSGNKVSGEAHRPAELYKFKQKKLQYVEVL
ncbi:MAG: NUDIX hydrolase [Candidatus Uhrbacteria bacterium GW2011_GWF2_41_16]|jgi:8-oxo-dGTP diphosphatase|uniref:NUDIX hydrolase n=2 Tax=Candidatus Uhriibacteriota TaxID=1752732 RepID=A0A0G0VAN3_9BACT|nr:MAG: NUDIX hydrolase [Candidatus Uhrbacteria bacterium GW2011_GWC2_41_11]KKR97969.1 MAG: NUDIX hydrolase [Candidatus Uhrbacteria bacterium GW2011_GWF2_41_16]HBP00224.1 NUDIX hydrolase [Candidatus Uhrbacteria bacterium]